MGIRWDIAIIIEHNFENCYEIMQYTYIYYICICIYIYILTLEVLPNFMASSSPFWTTTHGLSKMISIHDSPQNLEENMLDSLWPSYAIWRHRPGSTLAHVMACCRTTPSHYLNQYWFINSKGHWHSSEGNFTRDILAIVHKIQLENYRKFHSKIF